MKKKRSRRQAAFLHFKLKKQPRGLLVKDLHGRVDAAFKEAYDLLDSYVQSGRRRFSSEELARFEVYKKNLGYHYERFQNCRTVEQLTYGNIVIKMRDEILAKTK